MNEKQTPDEKKNILRARARLLAKEPDQVAEGEAALEVVEFLLAHERYGLESSYIREVYPLKEVTPVPCTPPFVLGIINLRGQILSVIDLKKFFNLPDQPVASHKVIVVYTAEMELGILVDAVLGVRTIPAGQIQPSLFTSSGIAEAYLRGLTSERLIILDIAKILSDPKLIVYETVET
jgi:purine-binding chemotaxis protein CheW